MSELKSSFTRDDLETLIESMDFWESMGNQEFHLMNMIKSAPLPPEDHEAFEAMNQIKEHFRSRERDIEATRQTRQEKAVFLKAKLMLVRRDLSIDQLFDMATEATPETHSAPVETAPVVPTAVPVVESAEEVQIPVTSHESKLESSLELAEFFIRDLGVWEHYQKFLKDRAESDSA
jgi:hypothetical protein